MTPRQLVTVVVSFVVGCTIALGLSVWPSPTGATVVVNASSPAVTNGAPPVPDLQALARMPKAKPASWPWDALKDCETPGLGWDANTGNGFSGGLQFKATTWLSYRPAGFPDAAWQATPAQQIAVAARVLDAQGWAVGWPLCSRTIGAR